MRLIDDFEKFLFEEVNLNSSRTTKLENHVESIENFIDESDWAPNINRYSAQGSWAHKTIIKPPGNRGFDADLLVFIDAVTNWTPRDYVLELRRTFCNSGTYKEKTSLGNRCVTIRYAGDFSIDVLPCVVFRPGSLSEYEVCNRIENRFEPTDSEAYTAWLDQRNVWIGGEKLREVTRLLKYLRDIKQTFSCKSILLTTLIGERVSGLDALNQSIFFTDLPTALKTLIGRLDNYLQEHSDLHDVCNPVLPDETFTRHWDAERYKNFRDVMRRYRDWIDDAYDEPDEAKARSKWQKVFGDEFGKGAKKAVTKVDESYLVPVTPNTSGVRDAVQVLQVMGQQVLAHIPAVVRWMKPAPWPVLSQIPVIIKASAHRDRSDSQRIGSIQSGEPLKKGLELRFEALTATGLPYPRKNYQVQWQVVNSDRDAWEDDGLRGGFYSSRDPGVRWEHTQYRGIHWIQAFLIRKRDGACVGRSERFFIVIE